MGEVVPFFADYCLCGEGKGHLRDKEEVYCLGNFGGERFIVSLVIRKPGWVLSMNISELSRSLFLTKFVSESLLERVQISPTFCHSQGSYWFEVGFTKIG